MADDSYDGYEAQWNQEEYDRLSKRGKKLYKEMHGTCETIEMVDRSLARSAAARKEN